MAQPGGFDVNDPANISPIVVWLGSIDSAGVTGTSLTIDCGYLTAAEWHSDQTLFQENV